MLLGVDFETYSPVPIARGAVAYASHPEADVICASLVLCIRGTRHAWRVRSGDPLPGPVADHVQRGGRIVAWNAGFEIAVWTLICAERWGWPIPPVEAWRDAAAESARLALPASLGGAAEALGSSKKLASGKDLIDRYSKPTKGKRVRPSTEDQERFEDYCEQDVHAMLDIWERIKRLPTEDAVQEQDIRVNQRGIAVDVRLAEAITEFAEHTKHRLVARAFEVSELDLMSLDPNPLKRWLAEHHGMHVDSLSREAIASLIDQGPCPAVREVLELREAYSRTTSVTKARGIEDHLLDGRLHNVLRYCGAHTGRWTSSGVQLHNLPRPPKDRRKHLDKMHQALLAKDFDEVARLSDRPLADCSALLRRLFVAAPGHELLGADFSAVEARVLAWLAGQNDVLEVFYEGRDIYAEDAAAVGSDNRQYGKVQRLALGYGMGDVTFHTTATADYGLDLTLKQAAHIKRMWRQRNQAIVEFWANLEDAFLRVIGGGRVSLLDLTFIGDSSCVRIKLPSGRSLHYWRPEVVAETKTVAWWDPDTEELRREPTTSDSIKFWRAKRGEMFRDSTYGGRLAGNVTQATGRDLLAAAMLRLENHGYPVVLHVHDSVVAEVEAGSGDLDEFCELLSTTPAWAEGLPMAAEGYRSTYFQG